MAGKGRVRQQAVFVTTGNPDTVNDTADDFSQVKGQLGQVMQFGDRAYQYVQLDPATAITPAANQVLFWKTRGSYIATNVLASSVANEVCGILRNAATAGRYIWMLVKGDAIPVKHDAAAASGAGVLVIPKAGSVLADSTHIAAGTAPTYNVIGVATAATAGGNISTNVNLLVE